MQFTENTMEFTISPDWRGTVKDWTTGDVPTIFQIPNIPKWFCLRMMGAPCDSGHQVFRTLGFLMGFRWIYHVHPCTLSILSPKSDVFWADEEPTKTFRCSNLPSAPQCSVGARLTRPIWNTDRLPRTRHSDMELVQAPGVMGYRNP